MRKHAMIIVGLGLAIAGCGGDDTTSITTTIPPFDLSVSLPGTDMATTGQVVDVLATDGLMFQPSAVTVRVGGTVRWRNMGSVFHTVTSGASSAASSMPGALFDHNPLAPGDTFEFTFTTVGTQPYFCRFHEAMGMKGTVTVTP